MGSRSTLLVLLAVLACFLQAEAAAPDTKGYIVFLDPSKDVKPHDLLQELFPKHAQEALVDEHEHWFTAKLSPREAQKLAEAPGVQGLLPDGNYRIDDPLSNL